MRKSNGFIRTALFIGTALAYLPFTAAAANASECPAEATLMHATAAFLEAAQNRSANAMASATSRFTDIRSLALFALGPYRSALDPQDEARYVSLTKAYMARFILQYGTKLSGQLTISTCEGNTAAGHFDNGTQVSFRVNGRNRIEDVSVSGISMAGAMRSKFTGIIASHNGDVSALMAYLRD